MKRGRDAVGKIARAGVDNVADPPRADARDILDVACPRRRLTAAFLLYPDPWPQDPPSPAPGSFDA